MWLGGFTIDIRSDALTERARFPNVFTPNHDGVNDEFAGSTWYATILSLRIYNRWGGCVYTSPPQDSLGMAPNRDVHLIPESSYMWSPMVASLPMR
ncbi:MAG TPA: gliding motility-associated C-terminal domain-containing protein [Saprospiraceae bacterium]|nr:gliding motility-associated C-terminal domain-containing protein [Saprospiraceae bacterium]